MESKNVYIRSIEASDIYEHMNRDKELIYEYTGMIPFSLELIKLEQVGFNVKKSKRKEKYFSEDIINVKFNRKVKSSEEMIALNEKRITETEDAEYKEKLVNFVNTCKENNWKSYSQKTLREILYLDGFKLRRLVKSTGEIKEVEYVVYKRSSSKSRTGQVLFIKKSLYKKMINWSRMELNIKENDEIDYPALLAYESLVGSALEYTIKINPDKILLISDVDSIFKDNCSVIQKGSDGFLESVSMNTDVVNSIFDGQSILDSKYFNGYSMMLLRNHMFKSASFSGNIQLFLKDNCPKNVLYENWEIEDMFGNKIYAKDIEMITTPNSLKALKFSSVVGGKNEMYQYWKDIVKKDECIFGVCKHEKKSKHGEYQQTSYQMLNSMPLGREDIQNLMSYEIENINRLKNDDEYYMEYLSKESNITNSNEMFCELYKINKGIVNTKIFRDVRKHKIKDIKEHMKRGKLRLKGDYCVLFGNPVEMLKHAIGVFDINKTECQLTGNEVYTTMFDFGRDYVAFRNPHTAPSNVLIVRNIYSSEIRKYFNLTDNIVCVNAIDFPIQDILSSCDYDSDTAVIFDNSVLLESARKCFRKYDVCLNNVESQKKKYRLTKKDMADIDNQLSNSQRDIGRVVNLGQSCMSKYWDNINKGVDTKELLEKVDVMTVLSCICIDLAKKFYEIDIKKEIDNVANMHELSGDKPLFWEKVSQSKKIETEFHMTPMDYLYEESNNIDKANKRSGIHFSSLLKKSDRSKYNKRHIAKIIEKTSIHSKMIRQIFILELDSKDRFEKMSEIDKEFRNAIKNLKIKQDTMIGLLNQMESMESKLNKKDTIPFLKVLFDEHKDVFLSCFRGV